MKSKAVGSFFLVLALIAGIMSAAPSAFADHMNVDVNITPGSSVQGCETTNTCFEPHEVTIDVGGEVTWHNMDTSGHTVTSGVLAEDTVGVEFNTGFPFAAGKSFPHKFTTAGEFPYFCQVHPWMTGMVTVEEVMAGQEEEDMETTGEEEEAGETYANAMSSDESIKVAIEADTPKAGEEMSIKVTFTNADGSPVSHINYDISATQDGAPVLSESGMHEHEGVGMHVTDALASDSPVDVQVTILGIGLPGEEANWTGPRGDVVPLQVTPEFGPVAMIILAIAVVSIIAVTAKTRVIPKL